MTLAPPPILARLHAVAQRFPDAVALEDPDGARLSYSGLVALVGLRVAELRGQDLCAGQLVALVGDPCAALVRDMLACWSLGAAFLPLDPAMPSARNERALRCARPSYRLDQHGNLTPLGGDARHEGVAYVIATSGSSGLPKLVALPHDGLVLLVEAQCPTFALGPGARALSFLSPAFDAFLSDLLTAITSGATLVFAQRGAMQSVDDVMELVRARAITHLDFPPSLIARIELGALPPSLRVVVVGGEPAPVDALRALASRIRVVVVYGPTEATVCTSLVVVDPQRWSSPSIGAPYSGVLYRVEEGELLIASPGLAIGYLGDEPATRAAFVERGGQRYYRTGDRVRPEDDGSWVFLGRIDRQVKLAGQRIELDEVEAAARSHARVLDAAAVLVDGRLALYVEPEDVDLDALREHLRRWLPRAATPRRITRLNALPRGPSQKLDRGALAQSDPAPVVATEVPRSDTERVLLACVAKVLGRAIGRDACLRDEGLDSLGALELAALLAALGQGVRLDRLMSGATLVELTSEQALRGDSAYLRPELEARARDASRALRSRSGPVASPHGDTILLSGATGFLGAHTLAGLLSRTQRPILCLVRASSDADARARVERALAQIGHGAPAAQLRVLRADLSAEGLGLSPGALESLADTARLVVHAAGLVSLVAHEDSVFDANLGATLRLAAAAPGARFVHASSLAPFVCVEAPAPWVREDTALPTEPVAGAYAASKLAAELALAQLDRPSCVVRFGLLTGHSASGRGHPTCQLSRFFRGLSAVACRPELSALAEVDITPVDIAARALVELSLSDDAVGAFHVAASAPASFDELARALERLGVRLPEVPPPLFFEVAARVVSAQGDVGTAALGLARRAQGVAPLEADLFLASGVRFDTTRTTATTGICVPPPTPDLLALYAREALGASR